MTPLNKTTVPEHEVTGTNNVWTADSVRSTRQDCGNEEQAIPQKADSKILNHRKRKELDTIDTAASFQDHSITRDMHSTVTLRSIEQNRTSKRSRTSNETNDTDSIHATSRAGSMKWSTPSLGDYSSDGSNLPSHNRELSRSTIPLHDVISGNQVGADSPVLTPAHAALRSSDSNSSGTVPVLPHISQITNHHCAAINVVDGAYASSVAATSSVTDDEDIEVINLVSSDGFSPLQSPRMSQPSSATSIQKPSKIVTFKIPFLQPPSKIEVSPLKLQTQPRLKPQLHLQLCPNQIDDPQSASSRDAEGRCYPSPYSSIIPDILAYDAAKARKGTSLDPTREARKVDKYTSVLEHDLAITKTRLAQANSEILKLERENRVLQGKFTDMMEGCNPAEDLLGDRAGLAAVSAPTVWSGDTQSLPS